MGYPRILKGDLGHRVRSRNVLCRGRSRSRVVDRAGVRKWIKLAVAA